MADVLHYPGDQRTADWSGEFGPDRFGALYTVTDVDYDPETDRTTVTFQPERHV